MATQIIAVLCEGPHDVAFIVKLLKAIDFRSNENLKINDFPLPINNLLKMEVVKSNVEDLNLQEVRQGLLPINTLEKNSTFIFLYSLGGDKKTIPRKKIIKDFLSFIPNDGEIRSFPSDTQLSILYFFDSDDKGVKKRIDEINSELEEITGIKPFENHKEVKIINQIKFGSYIFTSNESNFGKLEDILIPLMKVGNEEIFDNAIKYIEEHHDIERGKSRDFDKDKSTINIVGQLQKSGSSNVVCISQTDYLSKEKILGDSLCIDIIDYLNIFID